MVTRLQPFTIAASAFSDDQIAALRDAANDTTPGPLRLHTPDDILCDPRRARMAKILADHADNALPTMGERLNVVVMDPAGHPHQHRGMIRPATCVAALPGGRILVDFQFHATTKDRESAWVHITQCTFPDRIARGNA
ncbi:MULTISPECIES: hypothetical protein [Thalassospira]|uniref:Nuclear transport factor 2 family protein n=1 Tax=Thalassospira xiamenensis TaxID=220697 RepID=A0ABR5XWI4_9PROT|nr:MULTISPECIES: hypothetical protein [Thalassospira]KZC97211.1 hypothetical protein AUP40_04540 [Thalassospira xiamenensis]KZD10196.1 hypothetical protein AUP45_02670 [Thalassospira xiamenensis]MCD1593156.1 hypothetical protein [Thalassospira xiamenensis]MDM7975193.1 hypothetical protein [Thalassospira xiamenensis]OHZ01020.1 hypothetical protein BC440_09290 [Thalassospira sp. MIT1004]